MIGFQVSNLVLFLLIFLALYLFIRSFRMRKQERYEELEGRLLGAQEKEDRRKQRSQSPLDYAIKLANQSGMTTSRPQWVLNLSVSFIVGAMIGFLWLGGFFSALLLGVVGFACPFMYLIWRRRKYYESFRYGLVDLTEYGTNIFQVFDDLNLLMEEVINNSKNRVVVHECQQILRESGLGDPIFVVMLERAERSGIPEYKLIADLSASAFRSKGDLLRIYKDMNQKLKKQFSAEKRILAKTSGIRKIGMLISASMVPSLLIYWANIQSQVAGWQRLAFFGVILFVAFGVYYLNKVVRVRV